MNLYQQICFCRKCNTSFSSFLDYGFHVFLNHSRKKISNVNQFKDFVKDEIKTQIDNLHLNIPFENKIALYKEVKRILKDETAFPLKLMIPDGRKNKRKMRKT